jgi:hypothetical protein
MKAMPDRSAVVIGVVVVMVGDVVVVADGVVVVVTVGDTVVVAVTVVVMVVDRVVVSVSVGWGSVIVVSIVSVDSVESQLFRDNTNKARQAGKIISFPKFFIYLDLAIEKVPANTTTNSISGTPVIIPIVPKIFYF